MDVEQIIEELYGLRPEEFTGARDAYVAEARKARDAHAVKVISGLRRPTTAAWVSNLFVRERQADVDRLLALGEALREAHRTLDPVKMREASGQRHKVIAALAREAAASARDTGQPVSDAVLHDVEQIFHAVLAGPDVAAEWATGRLVKAPEAPVGFGEVTPEAALPRPKAAEPAKSAKSGKSAEPPKPAAKGPSKAETERRERRERDRAAAEAATAEARRRDEVLDEAEGERRTTQDRAAAADERVTDLERQLREAKQEQRAAHTAAAEAETAVKEAGRAARDAHRAADRARRKLERSAE